MVCLYYIQSLLYESTSLSSSSSKCFLSTKAALNLKRPSFLALIFEFKKNVTFTLHLGIHNKHFFYKLYFFARIPERNLFGVDYYYHGSRLTPVFFSLLAVQVHTASWTNDCIFYSSAATRCSVTGPKHIRQLVKSASSEQTLHKNLCWHGSDIISRSRCPQWRQDFNLSGLTPM